VLILIVLSDRLVHTGFGHDAVETFIIGAALSATSLSTTFAVITGASKSVALSQTRVGAVLVSAAVIDDVTGLVMISVFHDLGSLSEGGHVNIGWLIGRPIVAPAAMAILLRSSRTGFSLLFFEATSSGSSPSSTTRPKSCS
jgi:Kef-type K+ transport system membrane component KefB